MFQANLVIILVFLVALMPQQAIAQTSLDLRGGGEGPGGSMILGENSAACDGATEGALRYNSTTNCAEFCDGTDWACPSAAGTEVIPNPFSFTNAENQDPGLEIASNIVQITGIGTDVVVKISGDSSPEYRICANASCSSVAHNWTSANGLIDNAEYVQIRNTSSTTIGEILGAALLVGDTSSPWAISTSLDICQDVTPPAIGTVCNDGSVYAGLSPDGNVRMFTTPQDAPGGENYTWNEGGTTNRITNIDNTTTGEANTNLLVVTDSEGTLGFQQHNAAQYCFDLVAHGRDDWYLPASSELSVLVTNRNAIGNFVNISGSSNYWTSVERFTNRSYAEHREFDGAQGPVALLKYSLERVRCVRKSGS